MIKVVIIDDEPIIVEGLTKGIEWSKWGCQVVGTAYDGEEGLSVIKSEKPDIIFTDISMPKMDGLLMIAALKSEFPNMQISILTGFRDFDYAQQAIRLGVTRFLLKPSKFDELTEAIDVMTGKVKALSLINEPQEETPETESNDSAGSFVVKNAIKYMQEHYNEKLRLSDVADEVFVSQWHLSKLLNRHTGSNFSELLNSVRVEKAKELLKTPSLRICDIAEEVGFTDLTHFSRVFKKLEGISANEYRNSINIL